MVGYLSPTETMSAQWPHTAAIQALFFKETPSGLVDLQGVGLGLPQPALHSVSQIRLM